ncbi:MAG: PQQ-binding-like beta-propeller repeat protein [Alphaproteobacteria bacterium]
MRRTAIVIAGALLLGACNLLPDYIGEAEAPPLPGKRLSVLVLENTPKPDPRIADLPVRLPRPVVNPDWAQAGGNASHAMHHLKIPDALERAWKINIGAGDSDNRRLLATPVVAHGRVYTVDARGRISAFAAATGERQWYVNPATDEDDRDAFGGGLAYGGGRLYVTTGAGAVFALTADAGKLIWRTSVGMPIRTAPTLAGGRLFVITTENQLIALDARNGGELWSHSGIAETAQLMGGGSPSVAAGLVVAAYSSGEVYAIRADTGRVAWSDMLVSGLRTGALSSLGDINGSPVIDRDRAFAVSHAGRLVAISLRTGNRLWEQDISGVQTPWVAGEFLFVLTTQGDVVCLSRRNGRIRWVQPLPRYEDVEKRKRPIFWSGPVLAGDRLIVVSSHGEAVSLSPYDGTITGRIKLPDDIELPPVVADGTVYILSNDGDLRALR